MRDDNIKPSLPEGCKPIKAVPPDYVWQALCPREMRDGCLRYMRNLNEFLKRNDQVEDLWGNFCCVNCPHWKEYRLESQTRDGEAARHHNVVGSITGARKSKPLPPRKRRPDPIRTATQHLSAPNQNLFQVHLDGRPIFDPKENLELVRNQARSVKKALSGAITIINISTGQRVEI